MYPSLNHSHRRGFTLLELAVVLVVVGLMTGFSLQAIQSTSSNQCYQKTKGQLLDIKNAMENFAGNNNRYPKPAYIRYGSTNPEFGKEAQDPAATDPTVVAYATSVPAASYMGSTGGVLTGMLPVVALGLGNAYAADCWGSKFSYSVTNVLTSSNATTGYASAATGAISLRSGTIASPTVESTVVAYAVISHGEDKYGAAAMTAADSSYTFCTASAATAVERDNCNGATNANIFIGDYNNGDGAGLSYYDDLLVYGAKVPVPSDCETATVQWGGANQCKVSMPLTANGTITTAVASYLPLSTATYFGRATITCTAGSFVTSGTSCAVASPSCTAGSLQIATYAANCATSITTGVAAATGTPASNTCNASCLTYTGCTGGSAVAVAASDCYWGGPAGTCVGNWCPAWKCVCS
jgi:prepilin-type N-terminal cleavage/methylation domain-containing protein